MDRIHIRDLAVTCIVGANPHERVTPQTVMLNIAMDCDMTTPCRSDALEDTVDYKILKDQILEALTPSDHILIERMADHVATLCLGYDRIQRVTVTVDKPGALTGARSVAVEITRDQGDARLSGF